MFRKVFIALVLALILGTAATAQSPEQRYILAQAPSQGANTQDPAAAREELMLWSRIRDSNNPAEIEAFLAAFPNGRLASIARERLKSLREKPPTEPRTAPQTAPQAIIGGERTIDPRQLIGPGSLPPHLRPRTSTPVTLTTGIVAEVQERLFNLNYNPGPINGRMDSQTMTAVTRFQQHFSLPPSGVIDEEFLKALREVKTPSDWGALAFHARGAYSAVWQRSSRRQAEQASLEECQRRARSSCKLATAAGSQCIALAISSGRSRSNRNYGAFSYVGANLDAARGSVIEYCRRESPYPDTCEIRTTICADGSHIR